MSQAIEVTIREAKRDDMIQVHRLIRELAEFEKLEDQVKIKTEQLQKDGFDNPHPEFKCLVAELPDTHIVGFAVYFPHYCTWVGKCIFLEDLYVEREYRRKGIGKKLLLAVAKITYELGAQFDFHVLAWNPAKDFYKSLGAINLSERESWELFRFTKQSLEKLFAPKSI